MLSKTLYEMAPYGYLVIGALSVYELDTLLGIGGGMLLYGTGAVVWVLRSNYRRAPRRRGTLMPRALPEHLYELKPFILIALGVGVLRLFDAPLTLLAAVMLLCYSGYTLVVRAQARRRHPADYHGYH